FTHTMVTPKHTSQNFPIMFLLFFISINAYTSLASQPLDIEIKCGSCPCGNPCSEEQSSPPQPPPTPPQESLPLPYSSPPNTNPPPPTPPSYPPPPPPKLRPPPPPRFIYVSGEPTEVYYYYSAAQNRTVGLMLVLACLGAKLIIVIFG
ncbi:hypothetical protein RYX36_006379, partial [Vicia faba]